MQALFAIFGIASVLALSVGFLMLLFKKRRKAGFKLMLASVVILVGATYGMNISLEREAVSEGFIDLADRQLAVEAGFVSAKEWRIERDGHLARLAAQEEQETDSVLVARQPEQEQSEIAAVALGEQEVVAEAAEATRREKARAAWAERKQAAINARAAEELARQTELALKTSGMAQDVKKHFERVYRTSPDSTLSTVGLCRDDGYCSFSVVDITINIYGAGIVEIETTSQKPHSSYREVCANVYSAISGSDLDFSAELIEQAFREANQKGRVKTDMRGVQIDVKPDIGGIYSCRYFKY